MTVTKREDGTFQVDADEGKALRRITELGPTKIRQVILMIESDIDTWTDCELEPDGPIPRTFSKLKIVAQLTAADVWPAVKEYLISNDLYDLYLAAQDFAEDNPFFEQGKNALQEALGWTDEQVEQILANAILDQ